MKRIMAMLMVFAAVAGGCYDRDVNRGTTPEESGGRSVTIQGFAFNPARLAIKTGETVVWTNMDGVRHTVTSVEGDGLNSEPLARMETYSHTFNEPWEFNYFCARNPRMTGVIIAEEN